MRVRIAVVVIYLIMCSGIAGAQQALDLASISGRITDATGGVLGGAEVTARHLATNLLAAAITDGEGRFRLSFLRIGAYEVTVRLRGFQDQVRQVTLNGGAAVDLQVQLVLSDVTSQVTVTADPVVLDTARSQISSTVTEAEIRDVPLNGRGFLELALLVPGVSPTNVASTQLFPETSAVPGLTLSISSQRNLSNNFVVDGLSANDDAAALSGMTFSVDALEQFQVVTSGGQAELGRALGGFINVMTKSGTNTRQGTLYVFGRDDRLNAENQLAGMTLPMHEAQFGGSLGGPIIRNRTFYFASAEQRWLRQSGLVTIDPAAVDAINHRLAVTGYQGSSIATGTFDNPLDSTNVLAKVNHTFTPNAQMSVRYSLYDVTSDNARGAGGLSAATASSALDSQDQAFAAGTTTVLSSNTVLEARGQFAHSDLQAPPSDPAGPAVAIAGVAAFGTLSSSPTARNNTMIQVTGNLAHQSGAHAVRAGFDLLHNSDRITFPRAIRGSYAFSSLAAFLSGTYNTAGFTQTFGATEVDQANPNIGAYVQDEWHARPGLTVNLGLRYDLQYLETIRVDPNNISPRIGVAWSPRSSPRSVLRGSAGLFFDRIPLRAVANALLSADNTADLSRVLQTAVSLSPAQAGAPVFPGTLAAAVPSVTLVSFTTMDRRLQNPYSRQASVEFEQQLSRGATMSVGYQFVSGVGLLMSINQNVPTCAASGTNNGCRPNPDYANNSQYSGAGASSYHGLHVSLIQRPIAWGHYRVSYTWSRSMNNVGEFFFSSPIDPLDVSKDWGRSDDDQRHRLVVAGALSAPHPSGATGWRRALEGFEVSSVLQAYSAPPFNITSGVTTVQGTAGRPIVDGSFIPRNSGIGTGFLSLNLRVSRAFSVGHERSLELLVEGFNLTNHVNVVTRNTNFGAGTYPTNPSSTFGQVTGIGEPRSAQLGARLRF